MAFEWPIDRSDLPPLPEQTDPPSAQWIASAIERNAAEMLAVQIMWSLSGRQFGLYSHTARPCRQPLRNHHGSGPVTSYVVSWEGSHWLNLPCGCVGGCRVGGPRVVHLAGPVYDVSEVVIAGVLQPTDTYTVEGNALYRIGGAWPSQDLGRPLGEPGTWSVTYQRGIPVPGGVAQLTGLLAKEILTALDNDGVCRLPRTVTVASRQGVSYRAYDPAAIYESGKTGLPEVDLWLSSVNPHALMAAPTVL